MKKEHNHAVGNESVRALRYSPLSHRALAHPVPALPHAGEPPLSGASRQLSRGESQVYARGWRLNSDKANLKSGFFCCNHTTKGAAFMPSQSRSARQLPRTRGSQNVTFRLGLPRLRGRWPAGPERATNNAGPAFRPTPQRDPIFRDAKVLLFWCDQQQKE